MGKKHIFVANWKMFLGFNESVEYAAQNFDNIVKLSNLPNAAIVLCPAYPVIYPIAKMFETTKVRMGAQNCSAHNKGAFTGQVSAQSLCEVGCKYCIIGHSERRHYNNESDDFIAKKFDLLVDHGIIPIVCIGESEKEKAENKTLVVLEAQLQRILELVISEEHKLNRLQVIVAYEPQWSIGSGIVPEVEYLDSIFAWIHSKVCKAAIHIDWALLYGGSISSENVGQFAKIDKLSGFLVGKSSTQFQEFEKIIKRIYYPV